MILTINKVTRVTRHSTTAIDHVFTNTIIGNIEIKTAIVKTDISDHFLIIVATKNKIDTGILGQYIFKRNISDQSIDKLKQNYAISIETISKFYKMSMMCVVNFLKFFFPFTINAFQK